MVIPYEILIRGKDGKISGAHALDTPTSDARPLTPEDLAAIAPAINAAALATIAGHAEEIAAKDAELAAAQKSYDEIEAQRKAVVSAAIAANGDVPTLLGIVEMIAMPLVEQQKAAKAAAIQAEIDAKQAELAALKS